MTYMVSFRIVSQFRHPAAASLRSECAHHRSAPVHFVDDMIVAPCNHAHALVCMKYTLIITSSSPSLPREGAGG